MAGLINGEPHDPRRQHVLDTPSPVALDDGARVAAAEPVTAVFSRRVKPGREADFEAWAHAIIDASTRFPGHLGTSVMREPGTSTYHIAYRFADPASFRSWQQSPQRLCYLAQVKDLVEREDYRELTGLETWFALPAGDNPTIKPPPRWKMWLVSVAAIWALSLLTQWALGSAVATLPAPVRTFLLVVPVVTLMTYLVMPRVTRLLRRWLYPPPPKDISPRKELR